MTTSRTRLGLLTCLLLAVQMQAAGPAAAATLDLTGPAGAVISLNERILGIFPLADSLDLPPGYYTIRCHLPGHVPYEQTVRLVSTNDWQRVAVRLDPYSRRTAWSSNLLLAGLGQHYLGHGLRGYVYNAAEAGGLLTALAGELQRSNLKSDYLRLVDLYSGSINAQEITTLRGESELKYRDMQDMEKLRDTGLMIAGGAVVVSIIDALLSFPAVAAGGGPVPVDTGLLETPWTSTETQLALHAGMRVPF